MDKGGGDYRLNQVVIPGRSLFASERRPTLSFRGVGASWRTRTRNPEMFSVEHIEIPGLHSSLLRSLTCIPE